MLRVTILGSSQGLHSAFLLALIREFGGRSVGISAKPSFPPQDKRDRTCLATLGVTTVPSGSTTTKNCFTGLVIRDCSPLSPVMEKSSLAIPDRIKLPNEILCRIIEIAKRIAATIRDNRIKNILYKVSTANRADWMQDRFVVWTRFAVIHLFGYATNEIR
jgi:hypothetical protein